MKTQRTFSQIFFLKKSQSRTSELSIVYLRVTIDGVRTEISMHRQCDSKDWNSMSGRLKGRTEEVKAFNSYLETVQLKVYELYKQMISDGSEINCEIFKTKFLGIDTEKPRMLIEIFEHHNNQFRELVGKEFAIGTYKRFEVCKKSLVEFLQWKFQVHDLSIKKLNFEFIHDYEFYLKSVRNCTHNTVMGYIKKLKKVVRQCVAKNWLDKDPFMSYKITIRETNRTILSEKELQILSSKVIVTQRLEQVRDIFLFSCYTGLSYSDVEKLTASDISVGIDGEKWIFTTRTKTDTPSRIPLLSAALAILDKYNTAQKTSGSNKLLPVISNQRLNTYLKELADVCGIHKELTFHCARHTFATTVTLTNGVPIETVSKMLGHKSLRTTQHYAKILDRKVSDDMLKLRAKFKPDPVTSRAKKGVS
jgi:site-specific recombinase XerD